MGEWGTLARAALLARGAAQFRLALGEAQAVHARLAEVRADRDGVLATLGLATGTGDHPATVTALEHALRALTPPPAAAAPVRGGHRRVKVTQEFMDQSGSWHFADFHGQPLGPEDLVAENAEEAIRQGWAQAVAVEGSR